MANAELSSIHNCPFCKCSAADQQSLGSHNSTLPSGSTDKPFVCGICWYKTDVVDSLVKHVANHTVEKECGESDHNYMLCDKETTLGSSQDKMAANSDPSKNKVAANSETRKEKMAANSGPSQNKMAANSETSQDKMAANIEPSQNKMAANSGSSQDKMAANSGSSQKKMAANSGPSQDKMAANSGSSQDKMAANNGSSQEKMAANSEPSQNKMAANSEPSQEKMAANSKPSQNKMAANSGSSQDKMAANSETSQKKMAISENVAASATDKAFRCGECDFSTSVEQAIQKHMICHTLPFMCGECGHRAVTKYQMETHMRTHTHVAANSEPSQNKTDASTKPKQYKIAATCIGGASVVKQTVGKLSLNTGNPSKPLKAQKLNICGVCGFRTPHQYIMTRHLKDHTGQRPSACKPSQNKMAANSGPSQDKMAASSGPSQNKMAANSVPSQDKMAASSGPSQNKMAANSEPSQNKMAANSEPSQDKMAANSEPSQHTMTGHPSTQTETKPSVRKGCKFRIVHRSILKRQLRTHTGEKPIIAGEEETTMNSKRTKRIRVQTEDASDAVGGAAKKSSRFLCKKCHFFTSDKTTLITHLKTHRPEDQVEISSTHSFSIGKATNVMINQHMASHDSSGKSWKCGQCDYKTARKDQLRKHMATHTPEVDKRHKCPECNYKSARKDHLNAHMKRHSPKVRKPYTYSPKVKTVPDESCQQCGFKFRPGVRPSTHTGPFLCAECGFKTSCRFAMDMHARTHTICKSCGYKATDKSDMAAHKETTCSLKPHSCTECEFRAATKYDLERHLKTHNVQKKSFMCEVCGFMTMYRCSLTSHMLTHSEDKPLKCGECDYRTARKGSLRDHMEIHTGRKRFLCEECGYKTSRKRDFQKHMETHIWK